MIFDSNVLTSKRELDTVNGFLRVSMSNITKEQVRPYLGIEIPDHEKFNLDPNKVYNVLCPKEELEKAAKTFNNLPLTRDHIEIDVDDVPKEKIVGSLGDHATVDGKYLKNNLIIYDKKDIDLVLSGKKKELSCGYRYTPVRESGEFDGQHYDFKMTDIVGNHVALVKQGRAGRDVMVADSSKGLLETIKEKIMAVFDSDIVGDEFKESEHPRDKDGRFTDKSGSGTGSSLKDDEDVKNYWQKSGSEESQSSGKLKVLKRQLKDLKGLYKDVIEKNDYDTSSSIAKNMGELEKEIAKLEMGKGSEKKEDNSDIEKIYNEALGKDPDDKTRNDMIRGRYNDIKAMKKRYEEETRPEEKAEKKADLDYAEKEFKRMYGSEKEEESSEKDIIESLKNKFPRKSEKKDVFKSRFSKHTVRRDDPNYKAQLSAAKNDLKEAISDFEKNVENQEEKFKWIEQQKMDMAKADLEDLEKFEKESSKEESPKEGNELEAGQLYESEAKEYWDKNKKDDPVLAEYKSYEDWYKDSKENGYIIKDPVKKRELEDGQIYKSEAKKYWDENHKDDPSLSDYNSYEEWYKDSEENGYIVEDSAKQEKVGVVMKEFKEGELKSGSGKKVTDPKQAIAIALSEADKVTKDAIPEKQDEPKKAGEESALQQGEKKMAEEVKEEVKTEEKVETPAEEKPVEDACSKDAEIKKEESKKEEEVVEDDEEKDLKGKEKKAFAEGVDYGEKKEKEEPKKLDSEHESEGAKKADKEEKEKKEEMAKDSALVMDADALRAEGREQAVADFKCREKARKSVRSIVGDVDIFAFDSAEDIYKFACKEAGMNCDEIANFKDAFAGL
ncbi:MAG: DUF2213 domain-containing protein, partial [Methanobrevibacter sp.]|nr:DUF2213 domain-containing protein [Methanobrevibacter sp.]